MSHEEFKQLCKEASGEKNNFLQINRLDGYEKYWIRDEREKEFKLFKPVTDPFWKNSTVCKKSMLAWFPSVMLSYSKRFSTIAIISAFESLESIPYFSLDKQIESIHWLNRMEESKDNFNFFTIFQRTTFYLFSISYFFLTFISNKNYLTFHQHDSSHNPLPLRNFFLNRHLESYHFQTLN